MTRWPDPPTQDSCWPHSPWFCPAPPISLNLLSFYPSLSLPLFLNLPICLLFCLSLSLSLFPSISLPGSRALPLTLYWQLCGASRCPWLPTLLISPTPADSCCKTSGRYVCSSPTKTTPVMLQALHPLASRLLGSLNASAAHPECCCPAGLQPVLTVHHSCTPRTGNQRLLPFKSLVLA